MAIWKESGRAVDFDLTFDGNPRIAGTNAIPRVDLGAYRWNDEKQRWDPTNGRVLEVSGDKKAPLVINNVADTRGCDPISLVWQKTSSKATSIATGLEGAGERATATPTTSTTLPFLRRRAQASKRIGLDMSEVPQSVQLAKSRTRGQDQAISVTELSELEARALCAREDIPVFWPRPKSCSCPPARGDPVVVGEGAFDRSPRVPESEGLQIGGVRICAVRLRFAATRHGWDLDCTSGH